MSPATAVKTPLATLYRVELMVVDLGSVDFDFGCSTMSLGQ